MNICMVPARMGSLRLAKKNYLKIGKFSVLEIAILKAIRSNIFDRIVVNTDDPELEKICSKMGVDFYLRDKDLATSETTSDQVVLDFFNNNICERVFWLNTASPLQTLSDIINFVNKAEDIRWQSSISVNSKLVHSVFNSHPLNFNWKNGFARTQDLKPINCFNYAMMGWDRKMMKYLKSGQLFNEKTYLIESSQWSGFLLKNDNDMELIRNLCSVAPDQGIDFN